MTESEEVLVERAKEDPAAFGILYERYVDGIYSYIYHRTGNRHDAEDLTAKTFYKALANLHRYTDQGVPFSAWLYRIAHNIVANWLRDRSRHQGIPLHKLVIDSQSRDAPEGMAEANEEKRALREAIARLHPDRQQLLILKFAKGLSNAQIGQIMGRSEGAIKSLYYRTLIALKEALERMGVRGNQ